MGLIEDLNKMMDRVNNLPPMPTRIEVTTDLYYEIRKVSSINELVYGKPKCDPFGFGQIPLWIASEEEQKEWSEEEQKKQFKVVYRN